MNVDDFLTNSTLSRFQAKSESFEERQTLVHLAGRVLGKTLVYTCRNCYIDLLTELIVMYKHNRKQFDERMKEKRYVLKRGCCLPLGFGSKRMIVFQNCTDTLAIEFLSLDENNIQYFDHYPEDWKEDIENYRQSLLDQSPDEKEVRTPAELSVIEEMRQMLSEKKTKKSIKEHFVSFEVIGDKKVTRCLIDSLLKEASEVKDSLEEQSTDDSQGVVVE